MTRFGARTVTKTWWSNATNITTDGEFVLDNDSCQLEEALDHGSGQETVYQASSSSISTSERRSFVTRRDRFHACVSQTNAFVHVVLGIVGPNETKARLNSELERRSSDADFEKTMVKQFEVIESYETSERL